MQKNDGIEKIVCPYPIPETDIIETFDDFVALYYACGYFQVDMFDDKYKKFFKRVSGIYNSRKEFIQKLNNFLQTKTAICDVFE
jgi:hypothetical protein